MRQILTEIWSVDVIPVPERRRLAQAAVARAQGLVREDREGPIHTLASYEQVLSVIAVRMALPSVSVTVAKRWLRDHGKAGAECAAQLSKLSKLRNSAAHPVSARLLDQIKQLGDEQAEALVKHNVSEEQKEKQQQEHKDMPTTTREPASSPTTSPSPSSSSPLVTASGDMGNDTVFKYHDCLEWEEVAAHGKQERVRQKPRMAVARRPRVSNLIDFRACNVG